MVLELRDKLPPVAGAATPTVPAMSAMEEDVLSALVNLGYQRAAAEKALASVIKSGAGKIDGGKSDGGKSDGGKSEKSGSFDAMFREALASLSK
jgi:hypothetical protein